MLLNDKNYFKYSLRGKEKLYLDREEIIGSIYQYLEHILEYREAIVLTIVHEKQYKNPTGKHKEINPHSLETQKSQDYEKWREGQRGYKGIDKYFVWDFENFNKKSFITPTTYNYVFAHEPNFEHYSFLEKQTTNALIGIAFAFLTFLSRHSPLKLSKYQYMEYASILLHWSIVNAPSLVILRLGTGEVFSL